MKSGIVLVVPDSLCKYSGFREPRATTNKIPNE